MAGAAEVVAEVGGKEKRRLCVIVEQGVGGFVGRGRLEASRLSRVGAMGRCGWREERLTCVAGTVASVAP